MGKLSNIFQKGIQRPETRAYEGLVCSMCGSNHIVKHSRECGRVVNCGKVGCKGCNEYISSKQVSQVFKCLDCGQQWSIISRL